MFNVPMHQVHDFSRARRVFVFGDVHGELNQLHDAILRNAYDPDAGDRMIGLGDWLDRGPETLAIGEFIEEHRDDLVFVRGNHEELLWNASLRRGAAHSDAFDLWQNGGGWTHDFIAEHHEDHIVFSEPLQHLMTLVNSAPVAITVKTPRGRTVGCVHADVAGTDWNDFTQRLDGLDRATKEARELEHHAMWSRDVHDALSRHALHGALDGFDCHVRGVDHVFHGHSPAKTPIRHSNRSWIDTGACFKGGSLTFIEIDQWLSS